MRMIDQTAGYSSRQPGIVLVRLVTAGLKPLAALWKALGNRRVVNGLHDLTDSQLADIGLRRSDLYDAFGTSSFFQDPSSHLSLTVRTRHSDHDMITKL